MAVTAKVAALLPAQNVAVAYGTAQGTILPGQYWGKITNPVKIYDPDTQRLLGTWGTPTGWLRTVEVHDNFCVCVPYVEPGGAVVFSVGDVVEWSDSGPTVDTSQQVSATAG